MSKTSLNKNLHKAKLAKKDEFYTQLADIENELRHYKDHFRGKVIYCNCDDPYESNFFKYFAANFNAFGLKKLITTSFVPSPIAGSQLPLFEMAGLKPAGKQPFKIEIQQVKDINRNGAVNIDDVELLLRQDKNVAAPLQGNGDFRSDECVELLKQADIVVTNPPFSLFREYVAQLMEYDKKFIIIGNKNAITYKEVFKLIKENKMWVGYTPMGVDMLFDVPKEFADEIVANKKEGSGYKIINGVLKARAQAIWFTNLDIAKRHEKLALYKKYNPKEFPKYDNYDAINVNKTSDIPMDYDGVMGVPITFLDKYNPEQFEIVSCNDIRRSPSVPFKEHGLIKDKEGAIKGKPTYVRICIKHNKGGSK